MPIIVLAPSRLLSISDGDTPEVKMGVRLLGIDAPELHFPLGSSPESQDPVFAEFPTLRAWQSVTQALGDCPVPPWIPRATRRNAPSRWCARWGPSP